MTSEYHVLPKTSVEQTVDAEGYVPSVNLSGIHTYERQAAPDRESSLCPEPCCRPPKQMLSYPHPDPPLLRVLRVLSKPH